MRKSKRSLLILLLSLLIAGVIGGWWALPRLVSLAPGAVQQRLPLQVLALAATPLPTALPAPTQAGAIDVARLVPTAVPSPTATLVPTFTPAAGSRPTDQPTSSPTPIATATPAPPTVIPLPMTTHIDGVNVVPQKFNNCGPANLSLSLNFHGHDVNQLTIGEILKPNYEDRNVSPEEMVAYVSEQTPLAAAVFRGGDLAQLRRLIAAGYPVIIEKGLYPGEWEGWMGHYLTVIGYNDAAQTFTSLDTFLGPWDGSGRTDSYDTITEFWQQFNYTFIIVYPPQEETAVRALLHPALQTPETMWQRAAETARDAIAADPENPYAWFNLGSSLTHLAELRGEPALYANAAAAFDQARTIGLPWRMLWYQFEPYTAYLGNGRFDDVLTLTAAISSSLGGENLEETHYYRGLALQAAGYEAGGDAAFRRALELNPNFTPAQQALDGAQS